MVPAIGRHGLRRRAEIGLKRLQRLGIGLGKNLAIVVPGNRNNLSGIVHVRLVEFAAIRVIFARTVNDVAQMKKECGGRGVGQRHVEIGRHGVGDVALRRVRAFAGIADRVEADRPGVLKILAGGCADHVGQLHGRRSLDYRHRLQVSLDVGQHLFSYAGHGGPLRDRRGREKRMSKAQRLSASRGKLRLGNFRLGFQSSRHGFSFCGEIKSSTAKDTKVHEGKPGTPS